jgi:hypothetical protein
MLETISIKVSGEHIVIETKCTTICLTSDQALKLADNLNTLADMLIMQSTNEVPCDEK